MNITIKKIASQLLLVTIIGVIVLVQADICSSSESCPEKRHINHTLKVAIRPSPPFIIIYKSGIKRKPEGLSIILWEAIADSLDLDYEYIEMEHHETLEALRNGTIGIAISPLTITKAREKDFNFSPQYFPSGLTFAAIASKKINLKHAWTNIKEIVSSPKIRIVLVALLLLLFLYCLLSFRFFNEYCGNEMDENTCLHRKFFSLFIISLFMSSGIDHDIFRFRSIVMQILSLVLILFGITLSASIFGLVTATLTQSINHEPHYDIHSISGKKIAILKKSTAQDHLNNIKKDRTNKIKIDDGSIIIKDSAEETVDALLSGEVDLVLGDWAQLTYWANQKKNIYVQDSFIKFEPYGWGLPAESEYQELINCEMISQVRDMQWWNKHIKGYLGRVVLFSSN